MRHVLSILVDDNPGVLSRVSGLFSRRGYSIDSLSVGTTHDPNVSRMTIVAQGDEFAIEQIIKQVEKLIDVHGIIELYPGNSVYRELALIKVKVLAEKRSQLVGLVDIFRANIVDVSHEALTIEITGDESKILAFTELCEPYGIIEIVRTGLTALERGNKIINQHKKFEEE